MESSTGQYAHLVARTEGGSPLRRCPRICEESVGIIPDAYGLLSCFQGAQPQYPTPSCHIVLTGMHLPPMDKHEVWQCGLQTTPTTKDPGLCQSSASLGGTGSTLQHLANPTSWHYALLN